MRRWRQRRKRPGTGLTLLQLLIIWRNEFIKLLILVQFILGLLFVELLVELFFELFIIQLFWFRFDPACRHTGLL